MKCPAILSSFLVPVYLLATMNFIKPNYCAFLDGNLRWESDDDNSGFKESPIINDDAKDLARPWNTEPFESIRSPSETIQQEAGSTNTFNICPSTSDQDDMEVLLSLLDPSELTHAPPGTIQQDAGSTNTIYIDSRIWTQDDMDVLFSSPPDIQQQLESRNPTSNTAPSASTQSPSEPIPIGSINTLHTEPAASTHSPSQSIQQDESRLKYTFSHNSSIWNQDDVERLFLSSQENKWPELKSIDTNKAALLQMCFTFYWIPTNSPVQKKCSAYRTTGFGKNKYFYVVFLGRHKGKCHSRPMLICECWQHDPSSRRTDNKYQFFVAQHSKTEYFLLKARHQSKQFVEIHGFINGVPS